MKTLITIIIAVIIIVAIVLAIYFLVPGIKPEDKEVVPTDEISKILYYLAKDTAIDFSDIKDVEIKWATKVKPQVQTVDIAGKGFEAIRISNEQYQNIETYLKNKGFELDIYNIAAGTVSALIGLQKNDTVCTVAGGATGYKQAEGQWIPPEPDLKDVEVKCAKLTIQEDAETADWQNYTNQKYGYSFKYPIGCVLGPLKGECKLQPPEEREEECMCFLNGEDPDEVMMQAFTGPKDNLSGVSFSVSHSATEAYNPPIDTDLIEWIKEKFSYLENIPDETNFELDGTSAVKVYTPQSPQAFSQENIYFLHDNKLFNIYMIDVDNEDNKELYDNILSTFELASWETMDAKVGDSFSIILDANPTTGYEWQLDFDEDFIELVNTNYEVASDLIGAGGEETFDFKPLKAGETEITFFYARAWESVQPIEKVIYKITIE